MKKLENKVAVITGGTSGMALATAKLFIEEGANAFITGRDKARLDKAVKEIGKNVTGVLGDAANLDDLDRLYDTVRKEKGKIDILFASAGLQEICFEPQGSVAFGDRAAVTRRIGGEDRYCSETRIAGLTR